MSYQYEKLRELVPLYLNGRLSDEDKRAFEQALNQFPELKEELLDFSEIKGIYDEIEKDIPPPAQTLYPKVLKRVRAESRISLNSILTGYRDRVSQYLKSLFWSPRFSWGVVAVELVIILALAIGFSERDRLRTLTSRETPPREGASIHVVFDQESQEKEIREILNQVGATIIRGPSPEGLYIIEVREDYKIGQALTQLRKSKIVRFAEQAQ